MIMVGLGVAHQELVRSREASTNEPTMRDIVDFLKAINAESAKKISGRCPLTHGVVSEGSMLFIPPGCPAAVISLLKRVQTFNA